MDKTVLISVEIDDLKVLIIESENACLKHFEKSQPATDPDRLMNIDEAAAFLSLSKSAIYSMTCKGQLPAMKMKGGRKLYFSRKDLMAIKKSRIKEIFSNKRAVISTILWVAFYLTKLFLIVTDGIFWS